MDDTPNGEVRNRADAPAVTVDTPTGRRPLDDVLAELGGEADAPAWDDITDKPTSFPTTSDDIGDATATGRSVLTAANAAAGRSAIGAGTSNLALGTTSSTAAAGNHGHGAGLMSGSAPTVPDSTATDAAGLVDDYNALLAALRTRGVIS